jgi:hypothetical protein
VLGRVVRLLVLGVDVDADLVDRAAVFDDPALVGEDVAAAADRFVRRGEDDLHLFGSRVLS